MPFLEEISRIFQLLHTLELFSEETYRITLKRSKKFSADERLALSKRDETAWPKFRESFISYQADHGLIWNKGNPDTGISNHLQLAEVRLPEEVGKELARLIFTQKQDGDIREELSNRINNYTEINKNIKIDIRQVKNGFKNWKPQGHHNPAFVFHRNSNRFKTRLNAFRTQINEREFAKKVGIFLPQIIDFSFFKDVGDDHREPLYNNVDFAGFKIVDKLTGQEIHTYSFELKHKNDVPSVATAISQATNYRSFSNYSYIVLPNFERGDYYDPELREEYYQTCQNNSIGIVSVKCPVITNAETEFQESDLSIVLPAKFVECDNSEYAREMFAIGKYEFCPVCSSFIRIKEGVREGCNWKTKSGYCMKEYFEEAAEIMFAARDRQED